ncbi:hypothetical protein NC653_026459 [Populus alba x Populus x berolinensis]|uniref:Uncharacterized protein n=1 Tax=Populus alba x Populus x berolinensis TaxID=444605 RepID=A0AAD6QAA8_9ROSI|nr:hypothetical protein NC653_026459 [Populus alba x Populus x berolinensis]
MRLGDDSIGLYGRVQRCKSSNRAGNTAQETKAEVVQGQCSILARFEPNKFWGTYQVGKTPVDIQIFHTSHRPIVRFLTVQLERDGNLKVVTGLELMLKPAGFWTARLLLKPVSCLVRTVCAGPVSGPPVWIAGPR